MESETGIYVNSDHFPVIIHCETKLEAKQKRKDKGASWTGVTPKGSNKEEEEISKGKYTKEILLKYRNTIKTTFTNEEGEELINRQSIDIKIEALTTAMKEAAIEHLQPQKRSKEEIRDIRRKSQSY